MTERSITEKVIKHLAGVFRGSVILKHSDKFTRAIPDFSILLFGAACWIEMKYLRKGWELKNIIDPLQVALCHQIATTQNGRCWIVVFEEDPQQITIWTPSALGALVWPKRVSVGGPWQPMKAPEPWELSGLENSAAQLATWRAVRQAGWDYNVISKLIAESVKAA